VRDLRRQRRQGRGRRPWPSRGKRIRRRLSWRWSTAPLVPPPTVPIRVGNQQARPPVANRWRRAGSAFGCVSRLTRETREV